MNPHLQRGLLLYQQQRHALAQDELRLGLAQSPDDAYGHALLSQCLSELERHAEAEVEAAAGIRLAPDFAFAHYAMARVKSNRDDDAGALACIGEAVRLEPEDADYQAYRAAILFELKRWNEALWAAEKALESDPQHVAGNNVRAMALVKLGRKEEAGQTLDASLARDPDNAWTHANRGWTLLHARDPKQALVHFQESLRLDPGLEWARQGVVEALKARNPLYALVLRYTLWMARQSDRMQWGLIIGAYVGNRMLGVLAQSVPAVEPVVGPIRICYVVFVWFSWSAVPLSNLLLRLNRYGRLALFPEQIQESNWVGLCVALAVIGFGLAFGTSFGFSGLVLAAIAAFMVLPIKARYNCRPGWPRHVMTVYAWAMAATGALGVVATRLSENAAPGTRSVWGEVSSVALPGFLVALFLCGWIGNALAGVRPKK